MFDLSDLSLLTNIVRSTRILALDRDSIALRSEKGAFDYATEADVRVQAYLKENLYALWPSHQFIGEEGIQETVDPTQPVFIVDPIDGTTNLIHLYPHCAVSLAMVNKGRPVIGIVYNPFSDQLYYAQRGKGAYLNGDRICVSAVDSLSESLISIGTSPNDKHSVQEDFAIIADLFVQVQDIRRCGAAALEIVQVASGVTEAFFERLLKPWDFAAAQLILEEAGGCMTDFSGKERDVFSKGACLASNAKVHGAMLPYMQRLISLRRP